jgi:RNA polymerase sigma-70 factor (ECF subfamily)
VPPILNEEQLLSDIEADPQKFGQVYHAFHSQIFGYVYRRTADYEAARDITAETFLKAYGSIGRFKWRNISLVYWLYQIATNELNKYFNRKQYRPQSLSRLEEEYGIDVLDHSNEEAESIKLQEEMERHQEFVKMNAAIKKLDTKYGDVISLRFFEQKSIKEIAMILDKKEGTVKSLLSRGIDKLKETLKN